MGRQTLRWLACHPKTTVVWLLSAFALARLAWSWLPVTPLVERPGFDAALAHLGREAGPESFVVVWPPEQAAALAKLPPELRAADAVPQEDAERRRSTRVFVLGPRGVDAPPELTALGEGARLRFDDVEVLRLDYPRQDRVLFDLRQELDTARVSLRGPGGELACRARHPDGGWACPGKPEWVHVSPTMLQVKGASWPSVWAHPLDAHDLVIDLGERRLGDRVELEAALTDDAAGTPHGASVELSLRVGGAEQRLTQPNTPGVRRLEVRTTRGEQQRVQLVVRTQADGRRHLGVNVRLLEGSEAAP